MKKKRERRKEEKEKEEKEKGKYLVPKQFSLIALDLQKCFPISAIPSFINLITNEERSKIAEWKKKEDHISFSA